MGHMSSPSTARGCPDALTRVTHTQVTGRCVATGLCTRLGPCVSNRRGAKGEAYVLVACVCVTLPGRDPCANACAGVCTFAGGCVWQEAPARGWGNWLLSGPGRPFLNLGW